jgi:methyl-accepting chemotaxis protein
MGIRTKFNLVLLLVAAVGVGLFALISGPFMNEQAREDVLVRSRIMMDSAAGMRKYTAEEITPIILQGKSEAFHPQTVSSYAAIKNFSVLRANFPDYNYREAALNPTNPTDRATESEADIIKDFRANPTKPELITERDTHTGRILYLSRPIVAEKNCLVCHDTPDIAPQAMLAQYGRQNGFGWKLNEIVGAQIVSVPMAVPLANATKSLYLSLALLAAVFALLIVLINILLSMMIIFPVLRMSKVANDASTGKRDVEEYVKQGSDEVASLSVSLNRMRHSIDAAVKLLEAPRK